MAVAHNIINNASTSLATASIAAGATTFVVANALAVSAPFKATFASTGEIIEVGAISGTTWSSITRGAEGTTAAAYTAGARLELRITAGHITERRPFNVYPSSSPTANTLAIRAAIADGYVSLAPGTYTCARTGSETALFEVASHVPGFTFLGNGATIVMASGTPNTVDAFRFSYLVSARVEGFTLKPAVDGEGRHGIHFVPGWIGKARFSHITVGAIVNYTNDEYLEFSGASIKLTSSVDGFFTNAFRDVHCWGNISLENCGDSVIFDNVNINTTKNRILFDCTMFPLAGELGLYNMNGVGAGGAIRVVASDDAAGMPSGSLNIVNCIFETTGSSAPIAGALCYIKDVLTPNITGSKFYTYGSSSGHAVQLVNCHNATIWGNVLTGANNAASNDLRVESSCTNTYPTAALARTSNVCLRNSVSIAGTTRAAI